MAPTHAERGYVTDSQAPRTRHGEESRYRARTSVIVGLLSVLFLVAPSAVNAQSVTASCATAPGISDTCDRWYTGPSVAVTWDWQPASPTFHGTDRTSGVASCSSTIFGGPDGQGVPVAGTCVDVAGNVGSASLPINYDATPPLAPVVDSLPGNKSVALEWS